MIVRVRSDTLCATQREGIGGERKAKVERESRRRQSARRRLRKGSGNHLEAASERDIEARQRARGRKERRRSISDGKGDEEEAKEGSDESKIKKEKRNIRKRVTMTINS